MAGRWPNLIVVGAGKSGTSSLHDYLGQHPDVFMSEPKEPDFFSRHWAEADDETARRQAAEDYRALFADAGDAEVLGETSVSYFWYPPTADHIAETLPDVRIGIILRDPVERAYSHFLFQERKNRKLASFRDALEADEALRRELSLDDQLREYFHGDLYLFLEMGRYADHVERYLDRFGREQVHVTLLDDLKERPREALGEMASFLEIDPDPMEEVDLEVRNPYRGPIHPAVKEVLTHPRIKQAARALLPESVRSSVGNRLLLWDRDKPEMDETVRTELEEIYAPQIDRLGELLDRDVSPLCEGWTRSP